MNWDEMDWQIARKRGAIKGSVRAFVESPSHIVKNLLGHCKMSDRGLAQNGHQLHPLFGLANVVLGGRTVVVA